MRTHSMLGAALFLAASLGLAACGGAPQSGDRTSTSSAANTKGAACTTTLSDYCADNHCLTTWSAADSVCMNANSDGTVRMSFSCGSSLYALGQPASTSYYDSEDDGLVAIVDANGNCLGGPSDFAAPAPVECAMTTCGAMSCGGPPGSM